MIVVGLAVLHGINNHEPCSAGKPLNVTPKSRLHVTPHLFEFPSRHGEGRQLLCVPQKNGNRNFGALLHAAWFGTPPTDADDLRYHMDNYTAPWDSVNNASTVYFVGRNPYARILSEFLNHQASVCTRGDLGCTHAPKYAANSTGFTAWVSGLFHTFRKSGEMLSSGNHHLHPQLSGCWRPNASAVVLLQLEQQPDWFTCLLHQVNLSSSILLGDQWTHYSGFPCYYPLDNQCEDWGDLRAGKNSSRNHGVFVGPNHGTSAAMLLDSYYTRQTAECVTQMYAEDIRELGYPVYSPRISNHD